MDLNSFITLQIDVLISSCNISLRLIFLVSEIRVLTREHQRNQNTGELAVPTNANYEKRNINYWH
ncbi:hypothetical protein EAF00_001763 [Botryotinia globosa]|nr:hypothetical protein EAF00_001763 [Botryotinia globosa]